MKVDSPRIVHTMAVVGPETIAERVCLWCRCFFQAPLGRAPTANLFCGPECRIERARYRDRRRNATSARREYERLRSRRPERVAYKRELRRARTTREAAARVTVVAESPALQVIVDPWAREAPDIGPSLPCVSLDIAVSPQPKWPFDIRNMRGVHGAITGLLRHALDIRHKPRWPTFAPRLHDGGRLRVLVWDTRALDLLDGAYQGVLWDRPTLFLVEDAVEVASPVVERRGRQRVRLTALTPVVVSKDGRSSSETRPTAQGIRNSIAGEFLYRFGLERMQKTDDVQVELVSSRTEPVKCDLRGKYPPFGGWVGEVTLDVNAPALWLLLAAEKVGLGSRTAFGFGQVAVTVPGRPS